MSEPRKTRLVGFNHVALEVGDIDAALAFYGRIFAFELRSRSDSMAFIDLGDQFLALQKGRTQGADDGRHFGLVVEDKPRRRPGRDSGVRDGRRGRSHAGHRRAQHAVGTPVGAGHRRA